MVSKTLGHASHSAHCKHLSASTNPVMFTHQTPGPRYLLDPQGVSPHLREQTSPRQQPLRTQDPAPHTPSPNSSAQPLQQTRRGGGTQIVNRNAGAAARLLSVSMPLLLPLPNSGSETANWKPRGRQDSVFFITDAFHRIFGEVLVFWETGSLPIFPERHSSV